MVDFFFFFLHISAHKASTLGNLGLGVEKHSLLKK